LTATHSGVGMFRNIRTMCSRRTLLSLLGLVVLVPLTSGVQAAQDKIIVSGASGQLGELIVNELLNRGVAPKNLILVSHTPDKLADYTKQGAAVRFGDVTKPESLATAYAGGTRLLMISVGGQRYDTPRSTLHDMAFKAAVKAGVKFIAFTSINVAGSSDSPFAREYTQSEDSAKSSGAKWTVLRNGQYYEFLVLPTAIEMAKTGKAAVPYEEVKTAPITRADCAAAAATVLLDSKYENQTVDVSGPELVGVADIAAAVSAITGKRIDVVQQTAAEAEQASKGSPASGGTLPSQPNKSVQKVLGRPATGLREFLLMHKDELLAAK
jgi:NAD(P)H dehydrogenase (quinone)